MVLSHPRDQPRQSEGPSLHWGRSRRYPRRTGEHQNPTGNVQQTKSEKRTGPSRGEEGGSHTTRQHKFNPKIYGEIVVGGNETKLFRMSSCLPKTNLKNNKKMGEEIFSTGRSTTTGGGRSRTARGKRRQVPARSRGGQGGSKFLGRERGSLTLE